VTFHSLNSSVSVFNTCKKDFFCEPTGTLSTIGLCVRQESQRKENTCWSSPSLCEKGLQCSVEPLFWKQQVQNTAQQMNDLAHFFLSNKTLPTSYQNGIDRFLLIFSNSPFSQNHSILNPLYGSLYLSYLMYF
jgi:hypothetical protein